MSRRLLPRGQPTPDLEDGRHVGRNVLIGTGVGAVLGASAMLVYISQAEAVADPVAGGLVGALCGSLIGAGVGLVWTWAKG